MENLRQLLLTVGITVMILAVLAALIFLAIFFKTGKRLTQQLNLEYGPKDGKRKHSK